MSFWNLIILFYRDLYMSYQKKRIGEVDDDRLKFEISTMLSREVRIWIISMFYAFSWKYGF